MLTLGYVLPDRVRESREAANAEQVMTDSFDVSVLSETKAALANEGMDGNRVGGEIRETGLVSREEASKWDGSADYNHWRLMIGG